MGTLQKLAVSICILFNISYSQAAAPDLFFENASGSPIFKLLQTAKISIDIEIYEIKDVLVQNAVLDAIERGVSVRIIQESESVGSHCPVFQKIFAGDTVDCKSQKSFVQNIRAKGGFYIPFAYQQFCDDSKYRCLEHGKMVLVDSKYALISTGNFNASNLCDPKGLPNDKTPLNIDRELTTCNRDYSIVSSDPNVVSTLTAVFEADYNGNTYDLSKILKTKASQKITVSPLSMAPILQFIRSAKKSLLIENQYLKNKEMNDELLAAAKRGVKVFIVVNSACAFGEPDAASIAQWNSTFKAFDQAGVKTRTFTKQIKINGYNGYLHSKAIVVDGTRAWVGSVNGSTQALNRNREYGIFLNDLAEVSKLTKFIVDDFNEPNTESWQESLLCKKDF